MVTSAEIKNVRDKLGLTKTELGNLLDVSDQTILRWENGDKKPSNREVLMILGLQKIINDGGDELDIDKFRTFARTNSAGAYASLLGVIGGTAAATGMTAAAVGAAAVGGALLAPFVVPLALPGVVAGAVSFFMKNKKDGSD